MENLPNLGESLMADSPESVIADIAIVRPSPYQPRRHVNEEQLAALKESIARNGLIHTPVARRLSDGTYELVAGHQRYEAISQLINEGRFPTEGVPLDVRAITDEQAAAIALDENTQREDLRILEQVRAWRRMIDDGGLTQERVAELVGLDRATVSNYLRLLVLPDYVLDLVDAGRIKPRAARELLAFYNGHKLCEPELYLALQGCDLSYACRDVAPRQWAERVLTSETILEDFGSAAIRRSIYDVITRPGSGWRPLEAPAKNHMYLHGRTANLPLFDDEKFKAEFPESLYAMPQQDSGKSALWTNQEREWVKRQTAAKQAAKRAAATGEGDGKQPAAAAKPKAGPPWRAKYVKMIASDPVIRAAAPKGAFDPEKPDPEAMRAAGSRGEPLQLYRGNYLGGSGPFMVAIGPKARDDVRPMYFDEPQECDTCTKGARYVFDYADDVHMACVNRECYTIKHAQGREALAKSFERLRAKRDHKDLMRAERLAAELAALPMHLTLAIAEALMRSADTKCEEAGDYWPDQLGNRDKSLGRREPLPLARVRELLGIEPPDRPYAPHSWDATDATIGLLHAKPERAADVAALLTARLSWGKESEDGEG